MLAFVKRKAFLKPLNKVKHWKLALTFLLKQTQFIFWDYKIEISIL